MKLFRCSSLSNLIGTPKLKGEVLTNDAKSAVRKAVKEDLTNTRKFKGNIATEKGCLLEDLAIEMSGKMRFRKLTKHVGRVSNDLITGECDVLDKKNRLILDTKCSQDIDTHPWFADEAQEKVKKAGYDWQMQGYMWLYECEVAHVDFWLLPTPPELLNSWDDIDYLVHAVNAIDIRDRLTTVVVHRDEEMIRKIQERIPHCQNYYKALLDERKTYRGAA